MDPAALDEVRDLAAREFGLRFGEEKRDFLADILRQRMEALGSSSFPDYARRMGSPDELRELARLLTVPETFFFRGADQLRALRELVLPERIRARAATRELRLLSAGCAMGEEPYTLAMILRDAFPELRDWRIEVRGMDLNPHLLETAARARYSSWSLRETSSEQRERCFRREGQDYVPLDDYRELVSFRECNLSKPPPDALPFGAFDVVLCRNVIMYFTPEVMKSVVDRLSQALVPGGYLFLGYAETLRGLSQDFSLCHTHETFYYQKRASLPSFTAPPLPAPPPPAEPSTAWVDAIRDSSSRVESLARDVAPTPPAGNGMAKALDLLRRERFQEALDVVGSPEDLDARLLRAVLLSHRGRTEEAEAACAEILRADDLNAGAHHLIALCRERAGDIENAIEQNRLAQYLDAGFAMPALHVGRLARRKRDLPLARRQLAQALTLLEREDASRILLFGGGFEREALIRLCRSELDACGERP
jgi:chemotaxis protein methyltransferase CheR